MPYQACRRVVVAMFGISVLFIALLPSPAGAQVPLGEATEATTVCTPLTLYSNDFETGSGLSDWTVDLDFGPNAADWRGIQSCAAHSGSKIFRFGGDTCDQVLAPDERLIAFPAGATGIAVPAASSRTRLSFWHRWDFGNNLGFCWLELSVDGSAPIEVPAAAIVEGTGYTFDFFFDHQQSTFVNTVVDLDSVCALVLGSGGCAGHTIKIGFSAYSAFLSNATAPGWFLDDVTVTVCTARFCTGAPVIGNATTPSSNQVQVTWSNGTPPSASFNVYRALGTCAAPGPAEKIGSAVVGSPFLDTASGGLTFAYRVTGLDDSGLCESDLSDCVQAAPTGPCTLAPAFAGLTSATDPVQTNCTVGLSWAAASSPCGGAVTYTVYRGVTADFAPGPANVVASGITGTTFSDMSLLTSGATYFYVVRAVNSANGLDDGNLQRLSASPTGPLVVPRTLIDTFEGTESGGGFDLPGWSHTTLTGAQDWIWLPGAWYVSVQDSIADQVLVSPPLMVLAGSALNFVQNYAFDPGFDGGTLEITTDHGASWSVVPDSAFAMGGFTTTLYPGTGNPIAGKRAWSDYNQTQYQVRVDLSSWAGSEIQVRWHGGEDAYMAYGSWLIESVIFSHIGIKDSCLSPPSPLSFHTVTPCRLADTRNASGPLGGPALQPGAIRPFTLTGLCGVPPTAKALSLNVTVTQPSAAGFLTLYPGGQLTPPTSSINFSQGQTRANNAVLPLEDGTGILQIYSAGGSVHVILDVNGYFQ